jgi:hypothetical protein
MYTQVNSFLRQGSPPLQPGFAPFCSHLVLPNFCHLQASYLKITPENEHLLRYARPCVCACVGVCGYWLAFDLDWGAWVEVRMSMCGCACVGVCTGGS